MGDASTGPEHGLFPWIVKRVGGPRRLPLRLAVLAVLLASPSLFTGLVMDDFVHRLLLLRRPEAAALARIYTSPFAIANGDPAANHFLVEHGLSPWWVYDRLLLSFFRPASELLHRLDYALFPESPLLMHAHSLLWFGAFVAAAAVLYRNIGSGGTIAGIAALFFALDPSHGVCAGWVANRNALPAALFGVLTVVAYDAGRRGSRRAALLGPMCLVMGILFGEVSLGAMAYLFAHAAMLDTARLRSRALALLPYVAVAVGFRAVYGRLGYGAQGSGLYLDPAREPLAFLSALPLRIPLLVLGELGIPPAESYFFVPPSLGRALVAFAVVVCAGFVVTALPLVRVDRVARFWAAGAVLSLPLACTAYPHDRLLSFVSLGAMALLGQLFHDAFARASWIPLGLGWHLVARPILMFSVGVHLFLAPLLLPLLACSMTRGRSITERAVPSALDASEGAHELVVISAPEYLSVNLIPILRMLGSRKEPERLRMLSVGPVPLTLRRTDARTLELTYEGGLLATPFDELYRSARHPMAKGYRVDLRGMSIEVLDVTADGRPARARCTFEADLDSKRYAWVVWVGERYERVRLPAPGEVMHAAPARMPFVPFLGEG